MNSNNAKIDLNDRTQTVTEVQSSYKQSQKQSLDAILGDTAKENSHEENSQSDLAVVRKQDQNSNLTLTDIQPNECLNQQEDARMKEINDFINQKNSGQKRGLFQLSIQNKEAEDPTVNSQDTIENLLGETKEPAKKKAGSNSEPKVNQGKSVEESCKSESNPRPVVNFLKAIKDPSVDILSLYSQKFQSS